MLNAMASKGLPALSFPQLGITSELGESEAWGKARLSVSLFFLPNVCIHSYQCRPGLSNIEQKIIRILLNTPCPPSTWGTKREPFIGNKRAKQKYTHSHTQKPPVFNFPKGKLQFLLLESSISPGGLNRTLIPREDAQWRSEYTMEPWFLRMEESQCKWTE